MYGLICFRNVIKNIKKITKHCTEFNFVHVTDLTSFWFGFQPLPAEVIVNIQEHIQGERGNGGFKKKEEKVEKEVVTIWKKEERFCKM